MIDVYYIIWYGISASKGTCLHIMVSRQLSEAVEELVSFAKELKLKFEVKDGNGDTAIHIASR